MTDKENGLVDPHRNDWLLEEQSHDWIKAASALILLISAIAAILRHSSNEDNWRN